MRGVIQVRCQRPTRVAGAGFDDTFEVAVEGDGVAALPHLPAQALGDVQFVEEKQRTLRRRPPFQRAGVCQGIKPAAVGLDQLRQRQIVDDAGEPRRLRERVLGIGQRVIGRQGLAGAQAQQAGHTGDPLRAQPPGERQRPALRPFDGGLAKQAPRRSAAGGAKARRSA